MKRFLALVISLWMVLSVACGAAAAENEVGVLIPLEKDASIDLDEDGTEEAVSFEILHDGDGYDTGYRLRVGDSETIGSGCEMNEAIYTLKLSRYSEPLILVSDYGPSDDPETHFYAYLNGALVPAGTICAMPEAFSIEDGIITASVRGSVLYTWFHDADYALASGYNWGTDERSCFIHQIPRYVYPMSLIVTTQVDLPLIAAMNGSRSAGVIPAGSEVVLAASDDCEWVYIERMDGEPGGWLRLAGENGYECIVGDRTMVSADVFSGLLFAD